MKGDRITRLIGPLGAPSAHISVDPRHGRIGVVFLTANRFELWSLPGQESTHAISRN